MLLTWFLMDIRMPLMNGYEMSMAIRNSDKEDKVISKELLMYRKIVVNHLGFTINKERRNQNERIRNRI